MCFNIGTNNAELADACDAHQFLDFNVREAQRNPVSNLPRRDFSRQISLLNERKHLPPAVQQWSADSGYADIQHEVHANFGVYLDFVARKDQRLFIVEAKINLGKSHLRIIGQHEARRLAYSRDAQVILAGLKGTLTQDAIRTYDEFGYAIVEIDIDSIANISAPPDPGTTETPVQRLGKNYCPKLKVRLGAADSAVEPILERWRKDGVAAEKISRAVQLLDALDRGDIDDVRPISQFLDGLLTGIGLVSDWDSPDDED